MINKKLLDLREKYKSLEDKTLNPNKEQEEVLDELQEACDHPYIVETGHISTDIGLISLSRRICEVCGYEEKEEETGYKLLKKEPIREVSRISFYKLRKPIHQIKIS